MKKFLFVLLFLALSSVVFGLSNIASGTFVDLGRQASQTSINCFARCLNGNLLAGTASDGKILLSTDTGLIWNDLGQQATQTVITCLTFLENGIVLAGTATEGHILKSTDNGETWTDKGQIATFPIPVTKIYCITYCESGIVLAGTDFGLLFRSTDYGSTWTNMGEQYSSGEVISIGYLGSSTVMMATDEPRTLHRSIDKGLTWNYVSYNGEGDNSPDQPIIGFFPPIRERCYAFSNFKEIYYSADYGATWWEDGIGTLIDAKFVSYFSQDIKIVGGNSDGEIARFYEPYLNGRIYSIPASPPENISAGIYAGGGISILGTATQARILRHVASLPNELYPITVPTDWSPGAIATWTTTGKHPRILVGTYTPDPRFGEIGDIFVKRSDTKFSLPATQSEYLDDPNSRFYVLSNWDQSTPNFTHDNVWIGIGASGSGSGGSHSLLTDLDYATSGHTGFAAENGSTTIDFNGYDLYENGTKLSEKYAGLNGSSTVDFNGRYAYFDGFISGNLTQSYNSSLGIGSIGGTSTTDYLKFYNGIPIFGESFFIISGVERSLTIASDMVDLASGSIGLFPAQTFGIYHEYGLFPRTQTMLFEVTASGAINFNPLDSAPNDPYVKKGSLFFNNASAVLELNDGSNWVKIPKTGGEIQGHFLANDETPGASEDVVLPFEWGISSLTLHFKDGLYTGHTGP
ncbi:MAG: hypothetical protein HQM08_17455 [Candidatus Riflebacteria bacterium]|nr:hypothetical protein [Candidatus Riflebacteria bacterium]